MTGPHYLVFPVPELKPVEGPHQIGLIPGEYRFQDTSLNEFTFTVEVGGTGPVISYDAALEGFLTGNGTETDLLTLNSVMTIDATSLSHDLVSVPWFDRSPI